MFNRRSIVALVFLAYFLVVPSAQAESPDKSSSTGSTDDKPVWDTLPFLGINLFGGYDSNRLVLSEDLPSAESVLDVVGILNADVRLRRSLRLQDTRQRNAPRRYVDFGFGATVRAVAQDGLKQVEPFSQGWRAYADYDLFVCQGCGFEGATGKKRKLKRLSLGTMLRGGFMDIDGNPFRNTVGFSPALMFTWRNEGNCELDNLKLYYRYDDYDDREMVSDPAFDRDGDYRTFGAEWTVYQRFKPIDGVKTRLSKQCATRRGPFLRFRHARFWTFGVGYEYEHRDTDGSEFNARIDRYFASGQWPLGPLTGSRDWSIDGYLEIARTDHAEPSLFEPASVRKDDYHYLEIALRRHLKRLLQHLPAVEHIDLRLGAGLTRVDSNVTVYEYVRNYVFVGLQAGFKKASFAQLVPEGAGSQTVQEGGQSGDSPPVVAEELPDPPP